MSSGAPMKVAMYMPYARPGSMSWPIYQDFADAMRAAGADFTLVTEAPEDGAPAPPGTEFVGSASSVAKFLDRAAEPLARGRTLFQTAAKLRRWLRDNPVDALYMEMSYPLGAAAWLARNLGPWQGALVITPMGEDFLVIDKVSYGHRRRALPRWLIRRTMQAADAIRCISPMALDYARPFRRPQALIPLNLANTTLAAQRTEVGDATAVRAAVRRELGLRGQFMALALGRLHPFKGIHHLVEAVTDLSDVDLVIAGPSLRVGNFGDYGQFLYEQARQLGIENRVHLIGSVPQTKVPDLVTAADVVVVPSIRESMNRVCAEAAASGTPFIVSSSTGAAEFDGADEAGLVVPPEEPAAIRSAIEALAAGSWRPEPGAQRRFVEQFDAARSAPRLLELIRTAVESRG